MSERDATELARIIGCGAKPYHSGGNEWLVVIDGRDELVVFSEGGVARYTDWDGFEAGDTLSHISYL